MFAIWFQMLKVGPISFQLFSSSDEKYYHKRWWFNHCFYNCKLSFKNKHGHPLFLLLLWTPLRWFIASHTGVIKNGDNGQVISHTRNLDNPMMYYIFAILRIFDRAKRLSVNPNSPITIAMIKRKKRSIHLLSKTERYCDERVMCIYLRYYYCSITAKSYVHTTRRNTIHYSIL